MKHCNECGQEVSNSALFCKHCGHDLKAAGSPANGFCANCGKQVPTAAAFCNAFCNQCGHKLARTAETSPVGRPATTLQEQPTRTPTTFQHPTAAIQQKSNIGLWIVIAIIILVIAAFILMQQYNSAAYERTASGQAEQLANKLFG